MSSAHDAPLVVRPRRRLLRDAVLAIGLVLAALIVPMLFFAIPDGVVVIVIVAAVVHLVEVYIPGTTHAVLQLLALDEHGRRLFRMRGRYWTRHGMGLVAAATGAPVARNEEPLTQREFHAAWPQAAYWYENRPGLTALGFAGVLAATAGIVYGMLQLAGVPVSGA